MIRFTSTMAPKGGLRIRQPLMALAVVALTLALGCGDGGDDGVEPSESLNITGTWTGPATDNSGPGTLTFVLNHQGTTVTGTSTAKDDATGIVLSGTITGSVTNGNTFRGHMATDFGGCQIDLDFTATVSGSSMSGSYSGTNGCTGPVTNGSFQLTKQ